MADSNLLVQAHVAPRRGLLLGAAVVGAILILYMLNGGSYYPVLGIVGLAGAIAVYKASAITRRDPQWLIVPLTMLAIFVNSLFLAGAPRAAFHYGMVILFCAPCVPVMWREGYFRRGGFELYSIYFAWALFTISYSLARDFSVLRLLDATLVFSALSVIVFALKDADDVARLIERFVIGCGVFCGSSRILCVGASAQHHLGRPGSLHCQSTGRTFPRPAEQSQRRRRLMLITVGPTLAFWNRFDPRRRKWLGLIALMSVGEAVIADSRTPFIALTAGIVCYVLWRYRLRGILLLGGAGVLAVTALPLLGHSIGEYTGRGDVTTLTGRTEMWAYVMQEIKRRPFVGYGYEVAGMIFQSKYFPIWFGPWDEGAQSSLHNGYLNHAIGRWHSRDIVLAVHHAASVVVRDASERRSVEPETIGTTGRDSMPDP